MLIEDEERNHNAFGRRRRNEEVFGGWMDAGENQSPLKNL